MEGQQYGPVARSIKCRWTQPRVRISTAPKGNNRRHKQCLWASLYQRSNQIPACLCRISNQNNLAEIHSGWELCYLAKPYRQGSCKTLLRVGWNAAGTHEECQARHQIHQNEEKRHYCKTSRWLPTHHPIEKAPWCLREDRRSKGNHLYRSNWSLPHQIY